MRELGERDGGKGRGKYIRHSRNMINIRLIHHRRHRLLYIPLPKLIQAMFFPHRLEIEPGPVQLFFQKRQASCMCYSRTPLVVVFVRGEDPAWFRDSFFVAVGFHNAFEDFRGLRGGDDGDGFAAGNVWAGDVD